MEGILIGDCVCEKMQIRFAGCVTGNLQCASLGMDPSVVLKVRPPLSYGGFLPVVQAPLAFDA